MQLARFFHLLAAAATFAEAAPAAVSASHPLNQAVTSSPGLSNPETPPAAANLKSRSAAAAGDRKKSTQFHELAARSVITRFRRMGQYDSLLLSTGVNLVVDFLSVGRATNVGIPKLSDVANSLDTMGNALGQHVSESTGVRLDSGQLLAVNWKAGNSVTPAITSLEWQTLLFAMYQVISGTGWDYVKAECSIGDTTLEILLKLTG
ncbi:hypothetical protein DL765_009821 [Monosporascus sp. GIB2]|nr:hypothetical protein DL765_009821 [Monosporascus sp. GIB2]